MIYLLPVPANIIYVSSPLFGKFLSARDSFFGAKLRGRSLRKKQETHTLILSFSIFGFVKIRAKRVCCCFDMCHYLFEIDADLRTVLCVGYPVTVRAITATTNLQTSSMNASKGCIMQRMFEVLFHYQVSFVPSAKRSAVDMARGASTRNPQSSLLV